MKEIKKNKNGWKERVVVVLLEIILLLLVKTKT
jgi:hypothetical protein